MQRQIFFDLDHTLWDFDLNSKETLQELLVEFEPRIGAPIDFEIFFPHFRYIHKQLWKLYQQDQIESQDIRYRRFRYAFEQLGIEHEAWVDEFGAAYVERCPLKPNLVAGALETVEMLSKHFTLNIISNGFEKTQKLKLEQSGLKPFFTNIITSESIGVKKPDPAIFAHALEVAGCLAEDAVFIGDDYEVDVIGGCMAGLNTIFFNPEGLPNPLRVTEVKELKELRVLVSEKE